MENFVFDYYGYNVNKIVNNSFDYQGYTFLLFSVTDNEQDIKKLEQLILKLNAMYNSDIVFIVKNKYNEYISTSSNDNNICLLTYKKDSPININHFVYMHKSFNNTFDYKVNLQEIIILWDQRLEYIQNQCLVNLNLENESHLMLYEYTQYAIGLALNSLQYLSDINIDFNKSSYSSTLTHRRIKKMDKFELFNPFNLIIDHSSRDLAELYKNELINYNTLFDICNYYMYGIDEFEYLLARLLYPTFIFDIIEDISSDSSSYDYSSQIYFAISKQNKQIDKIKEFYNNIIKIMNIRPIEWINQI